jgi:hypothetical protein
MDRRVVLPVRRVLLDRDQRMKHELLDLTRELAESNRERARSRVS